MKYINAADILPENLLRQIQTYIDGEILYIPKASNKMEWGSVNGSRMFIESVTKKSKGSIKRGFP